MSPTIPPIAILGAGPAGLSLGRLLELANIDYTIFERDESAQLANHRASSGTLDIHAGSGQRALHEAGLFDEFKKLARWNVTTVIAEQNGNVVNRLQGEGDADRPEIDRKDLRTMLLNSVPEDKIRWNSKVKSVEKDSEGKMSIHLQNGGVEAGFRLIIGADGAWSKARGLVTPDKPVFANLYYMSTNIKPGSAMHKTATSLAGDGNYMAFGEEKMVGTMKLSDDSYYTFVGMRLPENWRTENATLIEDPLELRKWLLREQLGSHCQMHKDLFGQDDTRIFIWPLCGMPEEALCWKTVPGVALIGDAAHLTPPSGEGVNDALHDSVELAQQIVKHGLDDLDGAVAEYEKAMLPRAIKHSKKSLMLNNLLFAPEGVRGFLKAFGMDEGSNSRALT